MLDEALKTQLQAYLARLSQPIDVVAFVDDSEASREMASMLDDIAQLSTLVHVSRSHSPSAGSERTPSFTVNRPDGSAHIRFAGLPLGHEFTSLVLALLQVGGYPPKVDAGLIEQIRNIEGEFTFETYVSLTCQNCPDVVQALNLLAVLNPNIRHTMIDGALFQNEVEARQIMAVPTVYLNGSVFGQGRMSIEEIVARLDTSTAERDVERIKAKAPYDVLIVGGGPAGAAAAIYAARKGIRTALAAERFGGQVLDTLAIENFISVQETEGPKLAMQLEQHVKSYDVDIMNLQRAEALIPGDLVEVRFASGAVARAKSVIVATGARWREINVPGEREYKNRGVAYCPHCDGPLFKGKRVAVVGGGNSGVEAAIDLAGLVAHVTLVEFDGQLRADAVLTRRLHSLPNVTVMTSAQTTEISGDGHRVTGLVYRDRISGETHHLDLEGVFVQIGLLPNTDWLKGTVKLSPRGEIVVDDRGQTSVPGVFAAGDATTVPYKQIVIAMGDGAKASLGAFEYLIRSPVSKAA